MVIRKSDDSKAFNDFEHAVWEQVSEGYDRHYASLTRQTVAATLDAAGVGAGMRTLDVCTGPGMLAKAALQRGAACVGLDFSDAVITIARHNVPGAEFQQGDAQSLPFGDHRFDAVVCGYGVIHLPDPERALNEMRRVVRPGGRIAVSVWEAPKPSNGFGLLFGALKQHGDLNVALPHGPDFFQFSEGATMMAALQAVGLREISVRHVEQYWTHETPVAMIQAVLEGSVRARELLRAQTDAARSAIEAVVREGMKPYQTVANQYAVPMPAVVGAGMK